MFVTGLSKCMHSVCPEGVVIGSSRDGGVLCCTLLLRIQESFTIHRASYIPCDFKCYRAAASITLSCCPITTQLLCYHIPSLVSIKCRILWIAHTYIDVYIHTQMHTHTRARIYTHTHIYIHTHTHTHIYIYTH